MAEDQSIEAIIEQAVKRLKTQEAEARKKELELKVEREAVQKQKSELDAL